MVIQIILWVLIAAYVVPGFIFGFKKLIGHKQSVEHFNRWRYPLWFMHLLGLAEVTGSTLMLFNHTRIYGIAIFPVILAGAIYTHAKHKEGKSAVMKPVFVSVLLVAIFLITIFN